MAKQAEERATSGGTTSKPSRIPSTPVGHQAPILCGPPGSIVCISEPSNRHQARCGPSPQPPMARLWQLYSGPRRGAQPAATTPERISRSEIGRASKSGPLPPLVQAPEATTARSASRRARRCGGASHILCRVCLLVSRAQAPQLTLVLPARRPQPPRPPHRRPCGCCAPPQPPARCPLPTCLTRCSPWTRPRSRRCACVYERPATARMVRFDGGQKCSSCCRRRRLGDAL